MNKETNLKLVKSMAIAFLNLPVEETELSPICVMHPIFENGFVYIQTDKKIVNILENKENIHKAIKERENVINDAKDVFSVYFIIRKSYRLTFLKYIKDYLSEEDFSKLLADAWVSSENPNQDTNVTVATITKWFRKSDKRLLMTEEDYQVFLNLNPEIKIYRGVAVGRNPKGLSWTMNYKKAEWFANRFNTLDKKGYIQEATIQKGKVLAYFNTRGEEEIVASVNDMNNVRIMY